MAGCRSWLLLALLLLLGVPAHGSELLRDAQAELRPEGLPAWHGAVALTHRWDKAYPGLGGNASYTLWLDPAAWQGAPAAVFIEKLGNQASISLNGVVIQQLGRLGDERVDAGKASQLVLLPPSLLRADGRDELRLELRMQPLRGGGLSPLRVGPLVELEALQARQHFFDQTASAAHLAGFLLMGGLAAGLWWRQRDPLYGCFSLAALCGVMRPLDRVLPVIPMPWLWWGALLALAYGCQTGLLARFIVLALGQNPRWLVRSIYACIALVMGLAAASFALLQKSLWTLALGLMLGLSVLCLAVVLREALRTRRAIAWLVVASGGLAVAAGVHDYLLVRNDWLGDASRPLTPHAMFLFVVVAAGLVVARYSQTLADYRALNATLAERVAEREQHLRAAFEALHAKEQEQAVLSERQRMMREIHDGIGSQLVGLLNMVGHAQPALLEEQVRQALDEMRMAVDSLQPVHSDLTTVLATLRYRLQPRLQAAGIAVVWDVAALPPLAELPPQAVLQVQRILLEAFTNVLKHARATQVTVQARWQDGAVLLRLSDNGIGLTEGTTSSQGHGLVNMRARAASIGASLSLAPAEGGGCAVVMEWPQPG